MTGPGRFGAHRGPVAAAQAPGPNPRDNPVVEPFGINVRHEAGGENPGWSVWLPHQCSFWDIVGEEAGNWCATTWEMAVKELGRFVAEAQAALDALRRCEEFGEPDGARQVCPRRVDKAGGTA